MDMIRIETCGVQLVVFNDYIRIYESYKISRKGEMRRVLNEVKGIMESEYSIMENPLRHRGVGSMVREWVAHNNLYRIGYKRERVGTVDLNYPMKWYEGFMYWIMSLVVL